MKYAFAAFLLLVALIFGGGWMISQNQQLSLENKSLQEKLTQLQAEDQDLRTDLSEAQSKLGKSQDQVATQTGQINGLNQDLATCQKVQKESVKSQVFALDKIDTLSEQYSAVQNSYQACVLQNNQLANENKALKNPVKAQNPTQELLIPVTAQDSSTPVIPPLLPAALGLLLAVMTPVAIAKVRQINRASKSKQSSEQLMRDYYHRIARQQRGKAKTK